MRIRLILASLLLACGCRDYDIRDHVSAQGGLVAADEYAAYGREQAIAVAVGREFGRPYNSGEGPQARVAMNYARKFPDVVDIHADSLGHRLVVRFRSGWTTGIVPIIDGKRGDETRIPS